MLSIKTVLFPFRLSLMSKKPISVRTEITNTGETVQNISVKFLVSKDLSVERSGLANILEKKLGVIDPKQTKIFYFDVYPKAAKTEIKDYPARLIIFEHGETYEYVDKEYRKDFVIKVDK
jgi:hypothetical protein